MYDFNQYEAKYKSRLDTIIDMYQNLFNRDQVQHDYITMCALQADDEGNLSKGAELYQLLEHKFLTPDQFYGIDIDLDTIEANSELGIGNWVCSDIYEYLEENIENITPSVINLDTVTHSKRKVSNLISDVLLLLTEKTSNSCMVALNVLVNNPYGGHALSSELYEKEDKKFTDQLRENYSWEIAHTKGGWECYKDSYLYSSTNRTLMCTYIFYRK